MIDLHSLKKDKEVTVDTLFDGRLVCLQPRNGYRYSVDSLLLAHFPHIENDDMLLDIGCGCGIVGLIIFFRHQDLVKKVVGLELQPELAKLADRNVVLNGFGDKCSVVEGDLREINTFLGPESFSKVVCNPPFYPNSAGRESTNQQALIARHQICSSTDQVMSAASFAVKNKGCVSVVFPAEGLVELVCSMKKMRLQPKRVQMVFSYPDQETPARLTLVEARKNGGPGIKVLPPLYIYSRKNGDYSDQMQEIYRQYPI